MKRENQQDVSLCPKHVEIESLIINIELVASCWFPLFTYVHDARSQDPKTWKTMFSKTHVISPLPEIIFLIERILYPGIQIWMISSLRFRSLCQAMINSTDQLAHLRISINQYYIGERIHQLFLLFVYFYFYQDNDVRRGIKNNSPGNVGIRIRTGKTCDYLLFISQIKTTGTVQHVYPLRRTKSSSRNWIQGTFILQSLAANIRNWTWADVG